MDFLAVPPENENKLNFQFIPYKYTNVWREWWFSWVTGWGPHTVNLQTRRTGYGVWRVMWLIVWQIANHVDKDHHSKLYQIYLKWCVLEVIALFNNNFAGLVKLAELRTECLLGVQWLAVQTLNDNGLDTNVSTMYYWILFQSCVLRSNRGNEKEAIVHLFAQPSEKQMVISSVFRSVCFYLKDSSWSIQCVCVVWKAAGILLQSPGHLGFHYSHNHNLHFTISSENFLQL